MKDSRLTPTEALRDVLRQREELLAALKEMEAWGTKMCRVPRPDSPLAHVRELLARYGIDYRAELPSQGTAERDTELEQRWPNAETP